jgi:hypothetical protein
MIDLVAHENVQRSSQGLWSPRKAFYFTFFSSVALWIAIWKIALAWA